MAMATKIMTKLQEGRMTPTLYIMAKQRTQAAAIKERRLKSHRVVDLPTAKVATSSGLTEVTLLAEAVFD
jgi:hypothetical protein